MNIYEKLNLIQKELKVPKKHNNDFGGFKYRSCEDILDTIKPICEKYKTTLMITDRPMLIGEWHYIEAKVLLIDNEKTDDFITITASAREPPEKTKMDLMQLSGATSSYARKYALGGMFLIDDSKDVDSNEFQKQKEKDFDENKKISKKQVDALNMAISNANLQEVYVLDVLTKYHYYNIADIKIKDYAKIVEDLRKGANQ